MNPESVLEFVNAHLSFDGSFVPEKNTMQYLGRIYFRDKELGNLIVEFPNPDYGGEGKIRFIHYNRGIFTERSIVKELRDDIAEELLCEEILRAIRECSALPIRRSSST